MSISKNKQILFHIIIEISIIGILSVYFIKKNKTLQCNIVDLSLKIEEQSLIIQKHEENILYLTTSIEYLKEQIKPLTLLVPQQLGMGISVRNKLQKTNKRSKIKENTFNPSDLVSIKELIEEDENEYNYTDVDIISESDFDSLIREELEELQSEEELQSDEEPSDDEIESYRKSPSVKDGKSPSVKDGKSPSI